MASATRKAAAEGITITPTERFNKLVVGRASYRESARDSIFYWYRGNTILSSGWSQAELSICLGSGEVMVGQHFCTTSSDVHLDFATLGKSIAGDSNNGGYIMLTK